jgi:hypothetical protein
MDLPLISALLIVGAVLQSFFNHGTANKSSLAFQ